MTRSVKKLLSVLLAIAISVLSGLVFVACGDGNGDDSTAQNHDGKYYSINHYRAGDGDGKEVGYVEIKNGKCQISGDSPVEGYAEYNIYGNLMTIPKNQPGSEFREGMAGIINNGVIMTIFDGSYTTYCKAGKTPADIFENASGLSGKFISAEEYEGELFYGYTTSVIVVGNACLLSSYQVCSVKTAGSSVTLKEIFLNRQGFIDDGKVRTGKIADGGNAFSFTDERYDWTTEQYVPYERKFCKLGYGPDGKRIMQDEHIVSFDLTGGYMQQSISYPVQVITVGGKLNVGISAPDDDGYYPVDTDFYTYYNIGGKPKKSGFKFTAYNTERDGSGDAYIEGMEISEDCVFYAQWRELGPNEEW